eukprot:GHVT01033458.1.p3 GENE.GHVT01033458.1~~GHVT01033458.1.p3  ORF type:complete len:111 (-),score=5.93 GHVT01033458.1:736-1068(-)
MSFSREKIIRLLPCSLHVYFSTILLVGVQITFLSLFPTCNPRIFTPPGVVVVLVFAGLTTSPVAATFDSSSWGVIPQPTTSSMYTDTRGSAKSFGAIRLKKSMKMNGAFT